MQYYSQKDLRWANVLLGECKKIKLKQAGCFVVSLSMLTGIPPNKVNGLLVYEGGFSPNKYGVKCLINSPRAAQILGLQYDGRSWARPSHTCIAETSHYHHQGVPQHFFIYRNDGKIIDPLDKNPKPKKSPYHIKSYRLFKPKIINTISTNMKQSLSAGEYKRIFKLMWTKTAFDKLTKKDFEWWAKYRKGGDGMTKILQDQRTKTKEQQMENLELQVNNHELITSQLEETRMLKEAMIRIDSIINDLSIDLNK